MNKIIDKEKLLLSRFVKRLKRVLRRKKRSAEEDPGTMKAMALVQEKLERWVAEGKYRVAYPSKDSVLEDLGLTSTELTTYCATRLKKPFLTWRKELRIEDAKKMLLEFPKKTASEISKELGISDKSNFRHQFKSVTGLTPSRWREKYSK